MAWIEFHASRIKRLKKFQDFRKALGWSSIEALGFLGSFWGEVIELAEDGDISGWTPEYLIELTGLKTEPERVWEALASGGWIDRRSGKVMVHDWLDHAGSYLRSKYAKDRRDRLVEIWAIHGRSYGNPIGNQLEVGCTYLTLPNQPNQPNQPTLAPAAAFEWLWHQYPRQEGKKDAARHFLATVKNQRDFESIQTALANYKAKLARDHTDPQYIQQGKTWFNNWVDWVRYNGPVAVRAPGPPPRPKEVLPSDEELPTAADIEKAKAEAGLTKAAF